MDAKCSLKRGDLPTRNSVKVENMSEPTFFVCIVRCPTHSPAEYSGCSFPWATYLCCSRSHVKYVVEIRREKKLSKSWFSSF